MTMLPLNHEQLAQVRAERTNFQRLVGVLKERLGIDPDDKFCGGLHGFLVPVASRIRNEGGWEAASVPPAACFSGQDSVLYLYALTGDGEAKPIVEMGKWSEVEEGIRDDCTERFSFPRRGMAELQFYFSEREEVVAEVSGVDDYEEAWVYLKFGERSIKEQIKLIEAILAGCLTPIRAEALEKVRYLDSGYSDLAASATLWLERLEADRG